jgi:putative endonuclease
MRPGQRYKLLLRHTQDLEIVTRRGGRSTHMGAWLYILRCADGSYYTGTTRTTLEVRYAQHQTGYFGGYTATRRPVVLVYSEYFERIEDAIAAERQVKGWSRAKKEVLIAGRFDLLPGLSRRRS